MIIRLHTDVIVIVESPIETVEGNPYLSTPRVEIDEEEEKGREK